MQKNLLLKRFLGLMFFFGLLSVLVFIDQFLKYKIRHNNGFYLCNSGISFSVHVPIFIFWLVLAIFFLIFIIFLYKKRNFSYFFIAGLAFFIGGTLSNITDRLLFSCVLDYIPFFQKILPVFNVADVGIFVGSCFVFFSLLSNTSRKGE